jgi:hypothetical protein
MGDYTVSENTLWSGAVRSSSPPQFVTKAPGCTRICKREYVGDVVSAGGGFAMTSYQINPTNTTTFPWLSTVSQNYDSFRFRGLIFEYISLSATAVSSTNTALGAVILATQYNVGSPPFISKLQMDQYEYAVSTVPSQSAIHPIECKPGTDVLEVYYTYATLTGDPRLSTMGTFNLATVGQQAACNIGELWVSYDIELLKPRLNSVSNSNTLFGTYYSALAAYSNGASITGTAAFTGSPAPVSLSYATGSYNTLSFNQSTISLDPSKPGSFAIEMTYYFTGPYLIGNTTTQVFSVGCNSFCGGINLPGLPYPTLAGPNNAGGTLTSTSSAGGTYSFKFAVYVGSGLSANQVPLVTISNASLLLSSNGSVLGYLTIVQFA